jgi:hypothetical protein
MSYTAKKTDSGAVSIFRGAELLGNVEKETFISAGAVLTFDCLAFIEQVMSNPDSF